MFYILFALLNAVIRFLEIVLLKKCYALKSENVVWTIRFFDDGTPKLFIVARKLTAINIELSDAVGGKKLSRNIFPIVLLFFNSIFANFSPRMFSPPIVARKLADERSNGFGWTIKRDPFAICFSGNGINEQMNFA